MLLFVSDRTDETSLDAYGSARFVAMLNISSSIALGSWSADRSELPSSSAGYDAVRAVVLESVDLDRLSPLQDQALLEYLRSGGIVVLPNPQDMAAPHVSRLAEYLPVQVISQRLCDHIIPTGQTAPISFSSLLPICEAVANPSAQVLLRDGQYVHAAFTRVGRGRLIFTSFALSALPADDNRTPALWNALLDLGHDRENLRGKDLTESQAGTMEQMVGAAAPPWFAAALLAAGYVVLAAAVPIFAGSARRPAAMGMLCTMSIVASLVIMALSTIQRRNQPLMGARITLIDLTAGHCQQLVSIIGPTGTDVALQTSHLATELRPLAAQRRIQLNIPALSVGQVPVASRTLASVSRIDAAAPANQWATITGGFTAEGVRLVIDNHLGSVLRNSSLLWSNAVFRLPEVPEGKLSMIVTSAMLEPADEVSASEGLQDRLLRSVRQSNADDDASRDVMSAEPQFYGFLVPGSTSPALDFQASTTPQWRNLSMVRGCVQWAEAPIGQKVRVDAPFVRLTQSGGLLSERGLPLDEKTQQWAASGLAATGLFAVIPPRGAGMICAERVTVSADLSVASQLAMLRRGQCPNGHVGDHPRGPLVAEWSNVVGRQSSITFTCDSDDLDTQGRLWLRLEVTNLGTAVGGVAASPWQIRGLAISIEGTVIGPALPGFTLPPFLPKARPYRVSVRRPSTRATTRPFHRTTRPGQAVQR